MDSRTTASWLSSEIYHVSYHLLFIHRPGGGIKQLQLFGVSASAIHPGSIVIHLLFFFFFLPFQFTPFYSQFVTSTQLPPPSPDQATSTYYPVAVVRTCGILLFECRIVV